jgi:hypothetical protein
MNLIINGFHDIRQSEIIEGILKIFTPNKCCVILSDNTYNPGHNKVDILYVKNIINGNYGRSSHSLPYDFLEYINKDMSTLMDMVSRFEIGLQENLRHEERKRIIYGHFAFWYYYILENDYSCFISSNIPHDTYDYVILMTMIFLKKKTLYFVQTQYRDIIVPMYDYHEHNASLKVIFKKYLTKNMTILSPLAKTEWDLQKKDIKPFYMETKNNYLQRIYKAILNRRIFSFVNIKKHFEYYNSSIRLWKEYDLLSQDPDFSQKYIYLPLHYQPELTTNPMGGIFNNQILILDVLLNSIPEDVFIYVKEHPQQKSTCRYDKYYYDLCSKSKKIILMKKDISSRALIRNAMCVATVTGTAGWEALFEKTPVLLFGYCFYMYAPYVYNVRSDESCKKALQAIFHDNFLFNEDYFKVFLNAVADTSIHGFIDPLYSIASSFSFEESNANILAYIRNIYEKDFFDFN